MKLTLAGLKAERTAFEAKGYSLPTFDYETVKKNNIIGGWLSIIAEQPAGNILWE